MDIHVSNWHVMTSSDVITGTEEIPGKIVCVTGFYKLQMTKQIGSFYHDIATTES